MYEVNDNLFSWASILDDNTRLQAERISRLPILAGPVALMPDAHLGIGATVGSVIATEGSIIPSAVGVDIGCGMGAIRFDLVSSDLPDALEPFLDTLNQIIPAGVGQGHDKSSYHYGKAFNRWLKKYPFSAGSDQKIRAKASEQFGSLGSGNHFFEICLDEDDHVWLVLHSGSRGPGNMLAQGHIKKARNDFKNWVEGDYDLEDKDLAWFLEGTPEFDSYVADLLWAQAYAFGNRTEMMVSARDAFLEFVGKGAALMDVNCHHNFARQEMHNDKKVWVTRKGAISASPNDWGIIPGSMGARSFIIKGRGNSSSWNSCSHGAGRVMSRSQAKREFTEQDLKSQMGDRTWLSGSAKSLIDEIPSAYKDIDQVMEDQKDLVEIKHTLHQILNYKGV